MDLRRNDRITGVSCIVEVDAEEKSSASSAAADSAEQGNAGNGEAKSPESFSEGDELEKDMTNGNDDDDASGLQN